MGTRIALVVCLGAVAVTAGGCAPAKLDKQVCIECALRSDATTDTLPNAEARFRRGCDDGDLASCSVLGVMYEKGRGVPQDRGRAAQLFGHACRNGNPRACVSLGRMMESGASARADVNGAAMMYDTACMAGEREGCFEHGRVLSNRGELRRASELLNQACREGHAPACEMLGLMAQQGRGMAMNPRRAQKLFRRACLGGHTDACARL